MGAASIEFENWQRENRLGRFAPLPERECGLESRYEVTKIADSAGKHAECRFFVLDPRHDPSAVDALRAYASSAREAGFSALADDINAWVGV